VQKPFFPRSNRREDDQPEWHGPESISPVVGSIKRRRTRLNRESGVNCE
jgi:hypothetical protein